MEEKKKQLGREVDRIPLDELSQIWLQKKEVHLSELAPIWREVEPVTHEVELITLEFYDTRIQEFYSRYVLALKGEYRDVAEELLNILDKEGECSSVVNVATDIEASWNSTTYELLGKTSLREHTLNVAYEAIKMLEEDDSQFLIPDSIIVTLAHDIGKIPSIRKYLYALGEHPLTASKVLIGIDAFNQITKKDILLKAIKHHHKKPEDLLGKTLKRADQLSREKELEYARSLLPPLDKPKERQEQPSLVVAQEERKAPFKGVNIPWLDTRAVIDELRPQINLVQGRRFSIFSMSNGYVYVQPKLIETIARKQAENAGVLDVVSMEGEDMQKIMLSITNCFRHEGMLAEELVKANYYGSYFNIKFRSGYELKGYFTPFHAEVFGSIGELEQIKTGILLEFVSLELFNEKAKSCQEA